MVHKLGFPVVELIRVKQILWRYIFRTNIFLIVPTEKARTLYQKC